MTNGSIGVRCGVLRVLRDHKMGCGDCMGIYRGSVVAGGSMEVRLGVLWLLVGQWGWIRVLWCLVGPQGSDVGP